MAYKCETCKNNNNGWCEAKRMNGMKKANIQKCDSYKPTTNGCTNFKLEEVEKDMFGTQQIEITINDESVVVPLDLIRRFIVHCNPIDINIPN